MNYLILEELTFHAFHGVIPNEQIIGGKYSVSLKIGYDFSKAAETDNICDAINYAEIYDLIKHEMKQPSKLIEHVAQRIQNSLVKAFPSIITMETKVSKWNPPVNGEMGKATILLFFDRNNNHK